MNSPFFSVIVPTYNSSEFIVETINGFKNQLFKEFEIIFIDDKSEDNTLEIINNSLSNASLRYRVLSKPDKEQRGVATSRNMGVDVAEGKWIVFCDSDDIFDSQKLEKVKNYLI